MAVEDFLRPPRFSVPAGEPACNPGKGVELYKVSTEKVTHTKYTPTRVKHKGKR